MRHIGNPGQESERNGYKSKVQRYPCFCLAKLPVLSFHNTVIGIFLLELEVM